MLRADVRAAARLRVGALAGRHETRAAGRRFGRAPHAARAVGPRGVADVVLKGDAPPAVAAGALRIG